MKSKIVAVVVTYNRSSLLLECVAALKKSNIKTDILIVNNASTDNTEELVLPLVDNQQIFYVNTMRNLGGAGGFNFGLKKAYEMGYNYFWLMDDDTIVEQNSLTNILNAAAEVNYNFGFISSYAKWIDGSTCVMNHHLVAAGWGKEKALLQKGILRIEIATFVSFFTRREVVEGIGLPIKEYFIWGDDTEYSLRISKKFPSYLAFNSEVVHKMKENQNTSKFADVTDINRIERMAFTYRNGCCTNKRLGKRKLFRYALHCLNEIFLVLRTSKCFKLKKIWIIAFNFVKGLIFFNPKIEFLKQP